jgi:hypothetical protein
MSKTDEVLRDFLAADKPDWCIPTDVLVTAQLISLKGEFLSYGDMAKRCGLSDLKAVQRSLTRLVIAGWAVKNEDRSYTAQPDKLPKGETK